MWACTKQVTQCHDVTCSSCAAIVSSTRTRNLFLLLSCDPDWPSWKHSMAYLKPMGNIITIFSWMRTLRYNDQELRHNRYWNNSQNSSISSSSTAWMPVRWAIRPWILVLLYPFTFSTLSIICCWRSIQYKWFPSTVSPMGWRMLESSRVTRLAPETKKKNED